MSVKDVHLCEMNTNENCGICTCIHYIFSCECNNEQELIKIKQFIFKHCQLILEVIVRKGSSVRDKAMPSVEKNSSIDGIACLKETVCCLNLSNIISEH